MLRPDSQPLTSFETGQPISKPVSPLQNGSRPTIWNRCGQQLHMADKHATDFQAFLSHNFPPGSKQGTSGVYYEEFGDRIRAAIKDPSSADKNLCYYVKKNNIQSLNLPIFSC